MRHHALLAALVAAAAILGSLLSGAHRRAALAGATIASLTALVSMLGMARTARSPRPLEGALVVMAAMFLARLLLVGLAAALLARAGESIVGFVLAFFGPYFAFMAIEGAFLHSLRRPAGSA